MYKHVFTWYRHGIYMFIQIDAHLAIYIRVHTLYRNVYTMFGRIFLVLCVCVIVCRGDVHATCKYWHLIKSTDCFELCMFTNLTCFFGFSFCPACWPVGLAAARCDDDITTFFSGKRQIFLRDSTTLFSALSNRLQCERDWGVTGAGTSLRTCSLEQRTFQSRPPGRL